MIVPPLESRIIALPTSCSLPGLPAIHIEDVSARCRMCLDDGADAPLFQYCKCSFSPFHRACLVSLLNLRPLSSYKTRRCELCEARFSDVKLCLSEADRRAALRVSIQPTHRRRRGYYDAEDEPPVRSCCMGTLDCCVVIFVGLLFLIGCILVPVVCLSSAFGLSMIIQKLAHALILSNTWSGVLAVALADDSGICRQDSRLICYFGEGALALFFPLAILCLVAPPLSFFVLGVVKPTRRFLRDLSAGVAPPSAAAVPALAADAATTDPALALILRLRQRTGGIRRRRAFVFAMPARATEGGAVDVIASAIELHRIASGVESPQREDNGVDDAELLPYLSDDEGGEFSQQQLPPAPELEAPVTASASCCSTLWGVCTALWSLCNSDYVREFFLIIPMFTGMSLFNFTLLVLGAGVVMPTLQRVLETDMPLSDLHASVVVMSGGSACEWSYCADGRARGSSSLPLCESNFPFSALARGEPVWLPSTKSGWVIGLGLTCPPPQQLQRDSDLTCPSSPQLYRESQPQLQLVSDRCRPAPHIRVLDGSAAMDEMVFSWRIVVDVPLNANSSSGGSGTGTETWKVLEQVASETVPPTSITGLITSSTAAPINAPRCSHVNTVDTLHQCYICDVLVHSKDPTARESVRALLQLGRTAGLSLDNSSFAFPMDFAQLWLIGGAPSCWKPCIAARNEEKLVADDGPLVPVTSTLSSSASTSPLLATPTSLDYYSPNLSAAYTYMTRSGALRFAGHGSASCLEQVVAAAVSNANISIVEWWGLEPLRGRLLLPGQIARSPNQTACSGYPALPSNSLISAGCDTTSTSAGDGPEPQQWLWPGLYYTHSTAPIEHDINIIDEHRPEFVRRVEVIMVIAAILQRALFASMRIADDATPRATAPGTLIVYRNTSFPLDVGVLDVRFTHASYPQQHPQQRHQSPDLFLSRFRTLIIRESEFSWRYPILMGAGASLVTVSAFFIYCISSVFQLCKRDIVAALADLDKWIRIDILACACRRRGSGYSHLSAPTTITVAAAREAPSVNSLPAWKFALVAAVAHFGAPISTLAMYLKLSSNDRFLPSASDMHTSPLARDIMCVAACVSFMWIIRQFLHPAICSLNPRVLRVHVTAPNTSSYALSTSLLLLRRRCVLTVASVILATFSVLVLAVVSSLTFRYAFPLNALLLPTMPSPRGISAASHHPLVGLVIAAQDALSTLIALALWTSLADVLITDSALQIRIRQSSHFAERVISAASTSHKRLIEAFVLAVARAVMPVLPPVLGILRVDDQLQLGLLRVNGYARRRRAGSVGQLQLGGVSATSAGGDRSDGQLQLGVGGGQIRSARRNSSATSASTSLVATSPSLAATLPSHAWASLPASVFSPSSSSGNPAHSSISSTAANMLSLLVLVCFELSLSALTTRVLSTVYQHGFLTQYFSYLSAHDTLGGVLFFIGFLARILGVFSICGGAVLVGVEALRDESFGVL